MERGNKDNSQVPEICRNCTKERMEAVYCPFFPTLEDDVAETVQCANIGVDKNDVMVSGGKYNYSWRNLKPEGIKNGSTPGRGRLRRRHSSF